MVQESWISEHILRRQNHLCVPAFSTSSGEVCPARALHGSIPPAQEKIMTLRAVKNSLWGISHFIWLWTRLGFGSWLCEPDTAFLVTFSCLLSTDKQKELLIHEDNSRVTGLNVYQTKIRINFILKSKTWFIQNCKQSPHFWKSYCQGEATRLWSWCLYHSGNKYICMTQTFVTQSGTVHSSCCYI